MKSGYIILIPVLLLLVAMTILPGCEKKSGCTDLYASNYDPEAKKDCCCEYEDGKVTVYNKPANHTGDEGLGMIIEDDSEGYIIYVNATYNAKGEPENPTSVVLEHSDNDTLVNYLLNGKNQVSAIYYSFKDGSKTDIIFRYIYFDDYILLLKKSIDWGTGKETLIDDVVVKDSLGSYYLSGKKGMVFLDDFKSKVKGILKESVAVSFKVMIAAGFGLATASITACVPCGIAVTTLIASTLDNEATADEFPPNMPPIPIFNPHNSVMNILINNSTWQHTQYPITWSFSGTDCWCLQEIDFGDSYLLCWTKFSETTYGLNDDPPCPVTEGDITNYNEVNILFLSTDSLIVSEGGDILTFTSK